jgi:hypothetical protein
VLFVNETLFEGESHKEEAFDSLAKAMTSSDWVQTCPQTTPLQRR